MSPVDGVKRDLPIGGPILMGGTALIFLELAVKEWKAFEAASITDLGYLKI